METKRLLKGAQNWPWRDTKRLQRDAKQLRYKTPPEVTKQPHSTTSISPKTTKGRRTTTKTHNNYKEENDYKDTAALCVPILHPFQSGGYAPIEEGWRPIIIRPHRLMLQPALSFNYSTKCFFLIQPSPLQPVKMLPKHLQVLSVTSLLWKQQTIRAEHRLTTRALKPNERVGKLQV